MKILPVLAVLVACPAAACLTGPCIPPPPYLRATFEGSIEHNGTPVPGTMGDDMAYQGELAIAVAEGDPATGILVARLNDGSLPDTGLNLLLAIPMQRQAGDSLPVTLFGPGPSSGFHSGGPSGSEVGVGLIIPASPTPLLVDGFVRVVRRAPLDVALDLNSARSGRDYRIRGVVHYRPGRYSYRCQHFSD